MILDGDYSSLADLNGDGAINVQDIVLIVNMILGGRNSVDDATTGSLIRSNNTMRLEANGYIGGVQMTLRHGSDFSIDLTNKSMLSEYNTVDNTTTLVIVTPESDELFTYAGDFQIVDVLVASSSDKVDIRPTNISLSAAHPNPFNPTTSLELDVPVSGHVSVQVYNLMGQVVATLTDGFMEANTYKTLTWDASNVSSGMYLVKAQTANAVTTQKLMLLK
jgi:hypothetical protein